MSAFAYLIFIVVAVLACALGAVGAYFYYRARHREAVADLEALDQDLAEREEELHRLQYQFTNTYPGASPNVQAEARAEMQKVREELEQKKNDFNILQQDFDLELGILKQELGQLREEQTTVEHTRRHLARKDAELGERETDVVRRESDVKNRTEHLEAEIAAHRKHLEDEFAARALKLEDELAERDRRLRTLLAGAEKEHAELEHTRAALREKQVQLEAELDDLSVDKFSSRQEALLVKRLRQQIKHQRDELEHLQHLYHRESMEREELAGAGNRKAGSDKTEAAIGHPHARNEKPETAAGQRKTGDFGHEEGDSFPAFSTLSSYVDRAGESLTPSGIYDVETSPGIGPESGRLDDLTSLPGVNRLLQDQLYRLGITTFDQIARWSSADVRRVSEKLSIDRKTIQDHWIINAQSHLFSRKAE